MAESIHRDVFKLEGQNNPIRFGAKFIEVDGLEEKWSGEIPERSESEDGGQLIGRVITNSEGKAYRVNRITEGNPEGKNHYHQKYFWIEVI
jgi:hypothetical protein